MHCHVTMVVVVENEQKSLKTQFGFVYRKLEYNQQGRITTVKDEEDGEQGVFCHQSVRSLLTSITLNGGSHTDGKP